jgi:hypothetical protein
VFRRPRVSERRTALLQKLVHRNTASGSRVCALGDRRGASSREFEVQNEMTFFTHQVNGQTFGGWYRPLGPHEMEIMGAGFLCKTNYAGSDELSVACSVLEEFVRMQIRTGGHLRPLDNNRDQRDTHG